MKFMRIGELARAAGITVRALHHYDQIGLLKPTAVGESGHRLYNERDVERLQRIVSLKALGLSLDDIASCIDGNTFNLRKTLEMHQAAIEANINNLHRVSGRLRLMLSKLNLDQDVEAEELLTFMKEVQHMWEKYYTPEQLEKLRQRQTQYADRVREVEKAWPLLFTKFESAMKAKLAVTDVSVQVLAAEAQHYIDLFTGGDPGIEASLDKAYAQNQESALKTWGVSKEVFDYATRAREHLKHIKT